MSLHSDTATKHDPAREAGQIEKFRLLRYFAIAGLASFLIVGLLAYLIQAREYDFFADVQDKQAGFFQGVQVDLSAKTEQVARNTLVSAQEAANLNLTQLFANALWESDFAPFVARVESLPVDQCRTIDEARTLTAGATPKAREQCFAALGKKIRALPGFVALDQRTAALMRHSAVFKIKVYDMRGLTIYSSEHGHIGEDKGGNAGWRAAATGEAASELTHRDHFSAFEGMVENRDILSSYVPVRRAGATQVVGVFEIYTDVTPFLAQLKSSSGQLAGVVANNQAKIESTSARNAALVASSSDLYLGIFWALLALLFAALLYIVKRGQTIIDAQAHAREQSAARERLWHREKMSAMATMAANVSHEVGNASTVIASLAGVLAERTDLAQDADAPRQILEQSRRILTMSRQITAFATAGGENHELTDVNALIEAVCYFFSFDRRFRSRPIEFHPGAPLPACELVPDHLKEVLMNLLPTRRGRVIVESRASEGGVAIRIDSGATTENPPQREHAALAETQFEIARKRVADMGGELLGNGANGGRIEILLPACPPRAGRANTAA